MDIREFQSNWREIRTQLIGVANRVYELQNDQKPNVRFDDDATFGLDGNIFTLESSDWLCGERDSSYLDISMELAESILSGGPWEKELMATAQARQDAKAARIAQEEKLREQQREAAERAAYDRLKAKFEPTT